MDSIKTFSDFFNIPKRVELGMSFLNGNVDRRRDFLPYFFTDFENDPAWSRHDWPDYGDLTGRYVEAFVKGRKLLGISKPGEVEAGVRSLLMSYFDSDDGLSYRPRPDKPYYSGILDAMYDSHVAEGFDQSRVMWGLLAWYGEDNNQDIRLRLEKLLEGLKRVMIIKDDYGFYDRSTWNAGDVIPEDTQPMKHQLYFAGGQIHPLIEIYRQAGIPLALELAERLARFVVFSSDYFNADGSWNCAGDGDWASSTDGHVHSRLATIAGIATVGIVTSNETMISWARRAYDWFINSHSCSFGWSPEFLERFGDDNEGCETCAVMDDINCALALAEAGFDEYFDRAERVARNQLIQSQLLDTSIIKNSVNKDNTEQICFHDIAKMVRGGFAGWAGPNDFIGNCDNNYCLMNCCGPSGVTALCRVSDNIYRQNDDTVTLNMWMDKDDDLICINNLQPKEGWLQIRSKSDIKLLSIRRPGFLDLDSVKVLLNGSEIVVNKSQESFSISQLKCGDVLNIAYSLNQRNENVHVNGREYDVEWSGNTVTGIDPEGKVLPFYRTFDF